MITTNKAKDLTVEDLRELACWVNVHSGGYWYNEKDQDMTVQGVVNLYHASGEYDMLEDWFDTMSDAQAQKAFDKNAIYTKL